MKNIFIIPTDKPSRLIHYLKNNSWDLFNSPMPKIDNVICQNIYITNSEEIKEGEYGIDIRDNRVFKCERTLSNHYESGVLQFQKSYCRKIILTTDKDLIKFTAENDGVQAIDDTFLEWFVKNPSCEEVEVESFCKHGDNCPSQGAYDKQDLCDVGYKIIIPNLVNPNNQEVMFHEEHQEYFHEDFIDGKKVTVWLGKDYIPKEEPKMNKIQREIYEMEQELGVPSHLRWHNSKYTELLGLKHPKQETLEEVADNSLYSKEYLNQDERIIFKKGCVYGAKWQAEKMYNEEDVLEILEHHTKYLETFIYQYIDKNDMEENKIWFEQFKKK